MQDIHAKFTEIEKRVRSLVAENSDLRERLRALERELAETKSQAHDRDRLQGREQQIRRRIEGILRALEAAGAKEQKET